MVGMAEQMVECVQGSINHVNGRRIWSLGLDSNIFVEMALIAGILNSGIAVGCAAEKRFDELATAVQCSIRACATYKSYSSLTLDPDDLSVQSY